LRVTLGLLTFLNNEAFLLDDDTVSNHFCFMSENEHIAQQHPLRAVLNLLSETELANALGVEERTLQIWRQQQRGPDYVKLGKQVFYRCEDIRDWINNSVQVVRRL
jgi:hypothetical protein